MSDYISKDETISTIWNVFNSYGNSAVHFEVEETKAIRKFCSRLQREMELLPTLDEKEIIRKAFERVVERLEEESKIADNELKRTIERNPMQTDFALGYKMAIKNAIKIIKIVKEECGISE